MVQNKPYSRCLVIPRKDYAIEDTWFNVGMKGTGDVIVDDVFVPAPPQRGVVGHS